MTCTKRISEVKYVESWSTTYRLPELPLLADALEWALPPSIAAAGVEKFWAEPPAFCPVSAGGSSMDADDGGERDRIAGSAVGKRKSALLPRFWRMRI